jgi:hypothetical protein
MTGGRFFHQFQNFESSVLTIHKVLNFTQMHTLTIQIKLQRTALQCEKS